MSLDEFTSILCVALLLTLTMIFWVSYKQAILHSTVVKEQQRDYNEQMKRQEKFQAEIERQNVQHGKLLERQEIILTRVENLIAQVEKSLDGRAER